MSGDILIVDSITSNQILFKVKLSSAFYSVFQASSAQDALAICAEKMPNLVLVTSGLTDMGFGDFLDQIRRLPGCDSTPVVALVAVDDSRERLQRFREGAADVITQPIPDAVLLARLRNLLRNAHRETDLLLKPAAAEALGFAETIAPFFRPGRIAFVRPHLFSHAVKISQGTRRSGFFDALVAITTHDMECFDMGPGRNFRDLTSPPDAVILDIGAAGNEHQQGLAAIAELRTAPQTRNAKIIALMDQADTPLAATALDMGAHDVIDYKTNIVEVDLRLNLQINRKFADDRVLAGVRTGLQAAVTDPLTGLYNRRFGMSQLDRLTLEASQNNESIAIILADLDHFKGINDRFGHAAGDMVLMQVAQRMSDSLRKKDILTRFGGEEFLILLPDISPTQAQETASRLCQSLRNTPISISSSAQQIFVTMSLGVAMMDGSKNEHPPSPDDLLQQADRALYDSKSSGRNTVTFCTRSAA